MATGVWCARRPRLGARGRLAAGRLGCGRRALWAREEPARQVSQLADSVAWYSSLMPVSALLSASLDEAYSIFGLTEALSSDLHRAGRRAVSEGVN